MREVSRVLSRLNMTSLRNKLGCRHNGAAYDCSLGSWSTNCGLLHVKRSVEDTG